MLMRFLQALSLSALTLLLYACGGVTGVMGNSSANSSSNNSNVPQVQHVVVVVLENTNYSDVVGSAVMPYFNTLVSKGALAEQYYANAHPSIPNYFIMTTGQPVTSDDSYNQTVSTDNAVRELIAAGKSWKAYVESIPSQGFLGGDQFPYMRNHDPFSFFSDVQQSAGQTANLVPSTQLAADVSAGTLPNYSFIVPNALDDAHSCSDGTQNCPQSQRLQKADQWLQANIGPLLANSAFQQSGLLIITFDESADDMTNGGGRVATVLLGTHVRPGYVGNTTQYDHRSLLSLTMRALGVPTIPNGASSAPQMTEFFQ
ncbi:MAG TPA: alkaline phosphatase family protein [Terriglobales bacterium]|nr:alkaline phosphatase family protein [Terriglobales bacterium]